MKKMRINERKKSNNDKYINKYLKKIRSLFTYDIIIMLLALNIMTNIYLLIENIINSKII